MQVFRSIALTYADFRRPVPFIVLVVVVLTFPYCEVLEKWRDPGMEFQATILTRSALFVYMSFSEAASLDAWWACSRCLSNHCLSSKHKSSQRSAPRREQPSQSCSSLFKVHFARWLSIKSLGQRSLNYLIIHDFSSAEPFSIPICILIIHFAG